ncbi:5'-methylthioadenosine/adenosylhomocysteine nucleosidase [Romboutsia sp. 1001216sp1]|uniref:5'-methylthioadenosine/adenosylhomocysteine nucleosidase n=1 Tax=Romboutsia TaxID=1501226 RepID=UPI000ABABB52|nr:MULTISPECIES: 5'-methylthioadenosine/adenosylhomocysteine nucleosidase [Romboutsia]MDB8792675.1 5'-methylthioadenosine/adenosylhomocysteine nucleosidase [Romboutsia sp. 1001216sp1]MDB8796158.1 5'-methylthioadenosine/adenosylhomocysteine nucleosidase [Romboutsia sp. 1001216sp1]MDB8798151.1 5'-methylthioadenosine/adenosylhomocysteine nucleosidase [Romboutsia sp. 1001216sp1]MDB8801125.1 5'-methylthioadenosine/adenosylhomocysteine nucleosidase [Romboutsia sp. 1001216sp1]MDB8812524.1 5'-methylth
MKKILVLLPTILLSIFLMVGCTSQSETGNENVLGIIGAMEEEVEILKEKMDIKETTTIAGIKFYKGTLHDKNIVLVRSGVGKVNMAMCTQVLVDKFNVSALVNSGVAGTMNEDLNQGDVVISTTTVQHDFDTTAFGDPLGEISRLNKRFFDADKNMINKAKEAAKNVKGVNIVDGMVATGDQFVAGGDIAKKIKDNFKDVEAVEMEGAAMAQVAYLNDIPFVILRSISDKANGEADLSYEEFLPIAAKNASSLLEEFIKIY